MKNKIMDEPMVRKGIKERLVSRVMALVGLAVLYGVLGCFISLGLDDRPAVCWSLMGVLGISFVSALVVFLFEGRMSAPTAFRAKKAVVGFVLFILYVAAVVLVSWNAVGHNLPQALMLGGFALVCLCVAFLLAHFACDRYWGHAAPFLMELVLVVYAMNAIAGIVLKLV